MKIKILLPILLVIAISSCKKDLPSKLPTNTSTATADNFVNQRAGLPNPFDYLGVEHNQAMNFVKNCLGFEQFSNYKRYCAAYQFTNQQFPSAKMNEQKFGLFRNEVDELVNADDMAPKLLYGKGIIDLQTKMLLDQIYALFNECKAGTEAPEPSLIAQKLIVFETNLIKQYGCPSHNLSHNTNIAAVLTSSAIARYSYYYWYTVCQDPSNPWNHVIPNMTHRGTINWGQIWRTVKADFTGFWSSDGQSFGSFDIGTAFGNAVDASAGA